MFILIFAFWKTCKTSTRAAWGLATICLDLVEATCAKTLVWSFLLCFLVMTVWSMLMVEMVHPLLKSSPLDECKGCDRAKTQQGDAVMLWDWKYLCCWNWTKVKNRSKNVRMSHCLCWDLDTGLVYHPKPWDGRMHEVGECMGEWRFRRKMRRS